MRQKEFPSDMSLFKQRAVVKRALQREMLRDSFWFIIDLCWWKKWEQYVAYNSNSDTIDDIAEDHPGKIDNSNLLYNEKLKPDLLMETDITVVPSDVWNMLASIYGCVHCDTTVFERLAVEAPNGDVTVEIYPPYFEFRCLQTKKKLFEGTFSKVQSIADLESVVRTQTQCPSGTQIWLYICNEKNEIEHLSDSTATIEEASLEREKVLYVQFRTANGFVMDKDLGSTYSRPPRTTIVRAYDEGEYVIGSSASSSTCGTRVYTPGLCGLSNLGNTCFMNSAIQCMSNVPELNRYFLGKKWTSELNKTNPLGMHGRIATAYAALIERMWSGTLHYTVPREFKIEVSRFAPQFCGFAQHDAQELMMFLLDGLHEDLNRITQKPYIEVKDSDGRPDSVVSAESWFNHKARNDSIIVDLFHGQLKSTVVCPDCKYTSITFDPYASLGLPLPDVCKYVKIVHVWPWKRRGKHARLEPYEITIPSTIYVRDLIASLAKLRPPEPGCEYQLAEVSNYSIHRHWHPDNLYTYYSNSPIMYAYELRPGVLLPVQFYTVGKYNSSGLIGIPCYLSFPASPELVVSDELLAAELASRLNSIGLDVVSDPPADASTSSVSRVRLNDNNAGDRCSDVRSPAASCPVTSLSNALRDNGGHSSEEKSPKSGSSNNLPERDTNSSGMNGDESPLAQSLMGRLSLYDNKEREYLTGCTGALIHLPEPTDAKYYVCVDCSGTSFQSRIDQLKQNVYQTTQEQRILQSTNCTLTLSDCLKKFTDLEQLGMRDLWYCRRCKGEKRATKKFDLWTLPNVLVVHLKRFRSHLRMHGKIDSFVKFPLTGLNLTSWVTQPNKEVFIYDLIAVSNHMGNIYGGHYTAYAYNQPSKRWYVFDDACVQEVDPSRVVSQAAYVLVYQRRMNPDRNTNNSSDESSGDLSENDSIENSLTSSFRLGHISLVNSALKEHNDLMDVE